MFKGESVDERQEEREVLVPLAPSTAGSVLWLTVTALLKEASSPKLPPSGFRWLSLLCPFRPRGGDNSSAVTSPRLPHYPLWFSYTVCTVVNKPSSNNSNFNVPSAFSWDPDWCLCQIRILLVVLREEERMWILVLLLPRVPEAWGTDFRCICSSV